MENITFKQSYKNMFQLIKKSKGAFFTAFILVLIPVLIISCYSFYAVYGGTGLDFSKVGEVNMEDLLQGGNELQTSIYSALPSATYEPTLADSFLDILSSLMIYVLDAYVIILAVGVLFDRRGEGTLMLKGAIRKTFIMIIISMLASWAVYQVQSMLASTVFVFLIALNLSNRVFIMSTLIVALIFIALSMLLSCWVLLYIRHMTIATVSGRCRFLVSLSYAREILRGRVWKSMFKIAPFIAGGIIIPFLMQAFAVAFGTNVVLSITLAAISTVIQLFAFILMWIHTVPEFFDYEAKSGIQQKIRDMMERAMNMRKNQQTEDNNNTNDQPTDDKKE